MPKRALVVDNDYFFVEFLTELLEKKGYEIAKAYDGKEGISKLEQGTVDILFVDMIMPKIDGEQLIRVIRKKFPDKPFPIILMSGTVLERLDEVREMGADYYFAKGPIEEMAGQVDLFVDIIEKQPIPGVDDRILYEGANLHPRQTSAELMDVLNFQKAVIESIGLGIIVVDKDARIISANSMALSIIDKPAEEVLNYHITALFPAKEKLGIVSALKSALRHKDMGKVSLPLVTTSSQEVQMICSPFMLEGEISGWITALVESG